MKYAVRAEVIFRSNIDEEKVTVLSWMRLTRNGEWDLTDRPRFYTKKVAERALRALKSDDFIGDVDLIKE